MALLCASSFVGRAFAGGFSFGEPLEGRISTLDANSTAFLGCRSRAHSQSRLCCGHLVGRTSIFLATSLIIVQHRFSVTSLPFRLVVPPDCFCSPQYDSMKMVAVSLGSSCVGLPSKAVRQFHPSASKAHCCLLVPRPNAELRPNPLGKKHKLSVERATSWVWLLWRDERGPSRAQRRETTAAAAMCSGNVIP